MNSQDSTTGALKFYFFFVPQEQELHFRCWRQEQRQLRFSEVKALLSFVFENEYIMTCDFLLKKSSNFINTHLGYGVPSEQILFDNMH